MFAMFIVIMNILFVSKFKCSRGGFIKKNKSIFLVLFCLISLGFTQVADDFTATDTDGKTHNLYTYLTEGKHVALECMFSQ